MLTHEEAAFLAKHGYSANDVYDGRGQRQADRMNAASAAEKRIVLGNPCEKAGHRLRTRSGHCCQCDPKKLAYQDRHRAHQYVYIAGSKAGNLLKIGTASDIERRKYTLVNAVYGGFKDWEMIFYMKIREAGKVEGEAQRSLSQYQVIRTYMKDGKHQEAKELLQTSFANALNAILRAANGQIDKNAFMSSKYAQYG